MVKRSEPLGDSINERDIGVELQVTTVDQFPTNISPTKKISCYLWRSAHLFSLSSSLIFITISISITTLHINPNLIILSIPKL
ncbi:hypothetical protein QVD17_33822 [Tagetes erecta]|uniref:Uncharacterized protein n=1 Tax=Tagetes erecta TaxID=13708 RepID=A0AAD8K1D7_TARER|nr:hypothetical protein QVD17_33822 [Tagetes erecta]